MHQATNIAGGDNVGPALFDAINLVLKYAARDVRILDRKQPAKPAAGLSAFELD